MLCTYTKCVFELENENINMFIIDTLIFLRTFSKQVHYGRKIQNYAGYYCNDMHPN